MVREVSCKGLGVGLALQAQAKATFNDFNNKMYRRRSDVSTRIGGIDQVRRLGYVFATSSACRIRLTIVSTTGDKDMNKTTALWSKAVLALLAICLLVLSAARDLAPLTPASVVLGYTLGGVALFGGAALAAMWLKFAINRSLLNAGAIDTQWLWFKSDPKGLVALRSRSGAHQSNDDA
jgi:hypothetical protein